MQRIFITGTDTDAGKTFICSALLAGFRHLGIRSYAVKPIASGCDEHGRNADIDTLLGNSSLGEADINWHKFTPAIAPHLAAAQQGIALTGQGFVQFVQSEARPNADIQLIEGAGGWLLPLSGHELLSDAVIAAGWPVVLVVGVKLGCLNHALLTYRELARSGVPVLGFVANVLGPMPVLAENLSELQRLLPVPCLGVMPFQPTDFIGVSSHLSQQLLTQLAQFSEKSL